MEFCQLISFLHAPVAQTWCVAQTPGVAQTRGGSESPRGGLIRRHVFGTSHWWCGSHRLINCCEGLVGHGMCHDGFEQRDHSVTCVCCWLSVWCWWGDVVGQIRSEHWCHGHSEAEEHGEREQMYQCGDPGDVNWCVVLVQSHCVCGVCVVKM